MGKALAICLLAASAFARNFVAIDIAAPPGLGASDIHLLDDGHPQRILYCHSNQSARITVIVWNLSYAPVKSFAWTSGLKTMRRFESTEHLYFYILTKQGALLPVHPLPEPDSPELANPLWIDRTLPPLESTLALESPADRRAAAGLSNYLDLISRVAAFPGRKNLVCIGCLLQRSADWTPRPAADPRLVARSVELGQIGAALQEARVAVYPVAGRPPTGRVGAGNGPGVAGPGGADLSPDSISGFAGLTGGRAFNSAEVEQAITQAIDDGRSTYRIAYLPEPAAWNGKPHKLTVTASRGHSRLIAPTWYIAGRLEDLAREVRPPIPDAAIASPFRQTGIGLSVSPAKLLGGTVRVVVRVETADLLLMDRNGRHSGSFALQLFRETPEARPVVLTEPKIVSLDLNAQEFDTALRGGLRFPFDLPASASGARLRFVAHDEYSGETGTLNFVPGAER